MPELIICDVDGTLLSGSDPIVKNVDYVNGLDVPVVIVTGRLEAERADTAAALDAAGVNYTDLVMNDTGLGSAEYKSGVAERLLGDYDVNLMPADNFPLGQQITVMRKFNQQVNVSADGAVSINGDFGRTIKMTSPYQCTVLIKVGADEWQTLWPLYNPGSGVTIAAGNNNESSISSP